MKFRSVWKLLASPGLVLALPGALAVMAGGTITPVMDWLYCGGNLPPSKRRTEPFQTRVPGLQMSR